MRASDQVAAVADEVPSRSPPPGGAGAADRKPRVMFAINSLEGGGAERVMNTLLSHSEPWRSGFDFSLALLDREARAYEPPDWLEVHQLDCRGSLPRSIAALHALQRRWRPDVTLSFLTRANVAAVISGALRGRPTAISERVNTSSHFGSGIGAAVKGAMVRATYRHAARVIAVSEGVADELEASFGVPRRKLLTIENPLDVARVRSLAAEAPSIPTPERFLLGMGRLTPNKNFELLVRAYHRAGPPHPLLILGEGPEREKLLRLVRDLGLEGRVRLPGFVENPFPLLARADLYVLCSNAEGFPNSLVEAMAVGAPVVATNCASGPSEILAHRSRGEVRGLLEAEHGVLVPPDDVEAMAEALSRMQSEEFRAAMAARGRARAEDFRAETATARYWQVLTELVRG